MSRKLKIFRIEGGVRMPWILELDHQATVIHEYQDTATLDHVTAGRRPRREMTPVKKAGLALAQWLSRSREENPLPGSDDLRIQYFKDVDDKTAEFVEKGLKCPQCQLSPLVKRYRAKLEAGGFFAELQ